MSNLNRFVLGMILIGISGCSRTAWHPSEVMAEVERMSIMDLWPGFDPGSYPVAIFDGQNSYLFRHPAPPAEFSEVQGQPGVMIYEGRHQGIRSNSSINLAGIATGTYTKLPGENRSATEVAAIVIHELFHVYQSAAYPQWQANEATLFSIPDDDVNIISLRRMETAALRKAALAGNRDQMGCWVALAIQLREKRYQALVDDIAEYERGIELKEGIARYVQSLAQQYVGELPSEGFPAEQSRRRGYETGQTMALILDQLDEDWKQQIDPDHELALDQLLGMATGSATGQCGLSDLETAEIRAQAETDIGELMQSREQVIANMLARDGWQISITASLTNRLWPAGFDPINIDRLPDGRLRHGRWLKMSNGSATIEILDRDCLTIPAGEHPLFNGVKEIVVAGITAMPLTFMRGDTLEVAAEGFTLTAVGASFHKGDHLLTITIY